MGMFTGDVNLTNKKADRGQVRNGFNRRAISCRQQLHILVPIAQSQNPFLSLKAISVAVKALTDLTNLNHTAKNKFGV
jgi:hypothetical protein